SRNRLSHWNWYQNSGRSAITFSNSVAINSSSSKNGTKIDSFICAHSGWLFRTQPCDSAPGSCAGARGIFGITGQRRGFNARLDDPDGAILEVVEQFRVLFRAEIARPNYF